MTREHKIMKPIIVCSFVIVDNILSIFLESSQKQVMSCHKLPRLSQTITFSDEQMQLISFNEFKVN